MTHSKSTVKHYGSLNLKSADCLKGCIKRLNSLEYFERCARFSLNTDNDDDGASAMWTKSTGKLTSLWNINVNERKLEGYDYRLNIESEIEMNSYPDMLKIEEKDYENLVRSSGVTDSTSSSKENSGPNLTIDNKMDTWWESDWSDHQSLTVYSNSIFYMKQIDVVCQYASAQDYSIEICYLSEWKNVFSFTQIANFYSLNLIDRRCESFTFGNMAECRFVRINCKKRTTIWRYLIFEIDVYWSKESDVVE